MKKEDKILRKAINILHKEGLINYSSYALKNKWEKMAKELFLYISKIK